MSQAGDHAASPVRSWLYVSGARPEHFHKALNSKADVIVLDLEDSVPPDAKRRARAAVAAFLAEAADPRVHVRIGAPGTADLEEDLAALAGLPLGGVRLPKAERAVDVARVAERLSTPPPQSGPAAWPHMEVQPLIETARGLRRLDELLTASGVRRLALGEADLCADLGLASAEWLQPARLEVVVASRATRRDPPVQGVYSRLDDDEGLRRTTEEGRAMGFLGRSAIHPQQIPVIHAALTPSEEDVHDARLVLDALAEAADRGHAGVRLADGRFIDLATERHARHTLALADRTGRHT